MIYICWTVSNLDVLSSFLRFCSALDSNYLGFEEKFHAKQIFKFDLCCSLMVDLFFSFSWRTKDIVVVNEWFLIKCVKFTFRILIDTLKRNEFLFWLIVENNFYKLFITVNFLKKFFTIVFKAIIPYKSLLDWLILLCDEFANRHWHAFFFRCWTSTVKLNVEGTYHWF